MNHSTPHTSTGIASAPTGCGGQPAGRERPCNRLSDFVIHMADVLIALVCLIAFSPLLLLCAMMVYSEDRGPVIFRQERIGLHGKPFMILKFRTMQRGSENDGPQLCSSDDDRDPRLLKVGHWLRRHHLDELPQLWNVVRGDMAFVGPRPERLFYIEQIMKHDSRYSLLYSIRPGVTSFATLYNGYTDTMEKMLRRLELDLYYLNQRSIWLNIRILWLTFYRIASGKVF